MFLVSVVFMTVEVSHNYSKLQTRISVYFKEIYVIAYSFQKKNIDLFFERLILKKVASAAFFFWKIKLHTGICIFFI